jgi:O-antigen ligase
VRAHSLSRLTDGRYHLILAAALLLILGALGGASRADELQQSLVRFAAILVIVAALWPLDFTAFPDARGPAVALGLVYLLLLVQLMPMPPDVWARMPGHDVYIAVAQQTHRVRWRPWTLSPDLTLNALAALIPSTAMGLLTLSLDFRGRLVLARLIVAIACCSALLGTLQFAAGGDSLHLFRTTSENSAVGLFANRNHQAVFMACALPILAALASIRVRQEVTSGREAGLWITAGMLLLMGAAATGSRMGLLLALIGFGAAAAIYFATTPIRSENRSRFVLAGSGLALAAILPISLLLASSGAVARLAHDPVDQTRVAALRPMLHAARAFLPFGAGFGTFDPVYRRFEPDALLSTIYLNQAHNEPVQLAVEGGIPALILLLLFVVWWVRASLRTMSPKGSASRRALGMAMAATTLILMLSSLVDYPLRTPLLSSLFAIACVELVRARRRVHAAAAA